MLRKWKNPLFKRKLKSWSTFKKTTIRNPENDIKEILDFKNSLPSPLKKLFLLLQNEGVSTYLVGGGVRDWLLKYKNLDLDFTLDTDITRINPKIFKTAGIKKFEFFPRFLTAKLYLLKKTVDLASFRKEKYPEPGKLPQVEFTPNIKEDALRRDFSINALYLRIYPPPISFLDPLNGFSDLKEGELRILHSKSFEDDPTRILRGIRFAVNLQLKFEKGTSILLKRAILRNYLASISATRYLKEMEKLYKTIGNYPEFFLLILSFKLINSFVAEELSDNYCEKKLLPIFDTDFSFYNLPFKVVFSAFLIYILQDIWDTSKLKSLIAQIGLKQKILRNWSPRTWPEILILFSRYFSN